MRFLYRFLVTVFLAEVFLFFIFLLHWLYGLNIMKEFLDWLAQPSTWPVIIVLVSALGLALRWVWRGPSGGLGITKHGFGIDHGLQLNVELSRPTLLPSEHGNLLVFAMRIRFRNHLGKEIRICDMRLRLCTHGIFPRLLGECPFVDASGQPIVIDCRLAPLGDSDTFNTSVQVPVTAKILYAIQSEKSPLFQFIVNRIGASPETVVVEPKILDWSQTETEKLQDERSQT